MQSHKVPENSSIVEPHLAAAALARVLGLPAWQGHTERAKELAPNANRVMVERIVKRIQDL